MTSIERLQQLTAEYRASGQSWPATNLQIATWAWDNALWRPQPSNMIARLAAELSDAMRQEYFVDAQGRTVRAYHSARVMRNGEQLNLWDDMRSADREFMVIAFQQRRQQIIGDCVQLKLDADSYNENQNPGSPIQLVFDFTDDIAEREALENLEREAV
jgi:hypothetical protein